jgi:DedD protein
MREGAKQRLLGAVVIVTLVVIFVPMLFERGSLDTLPPIQESIPQPPGFERELKTEVFLGPEDSGIGGLEEPGETVTEPLALPPPAGDLEPAPVDEGAPAEALDLPAEEDEVPNQEAPPAEQAAAPVTTAPPSAPPGSWVIQVASLAAPDVAAELEGRLRLAGFSAFVERATVNGRLWFRVRVGPQPDRAKAEQTAALLRERHRLDTLIQRYP